jgi:hypothetical protein
VAANLVAVAAAELFSDTLPTFFHFLPLLCQKHIFMNFKKICWLWLVAAAIWQGCDKNERPAFSGQGKKPVYVTLSALQQIGNQPPAPLVQSGTIFLQDSLLFILEDRKGIHVFDITDTLNTINLTFISIPAVTDFTVSGNRIYADSWTDLVVVDISDILQVVEISRLAGVIQPPLYPPAYDGVFECIDESKGAVVGWTDTVLTNAACITAN